MLNEMLKRCVFTLRLILSEVLAALTNSSELFQTYGLAIESASVTDGFSLVQRTAIATVLSSDERRSRVTHGKTIRIAAVACTAILSPR